MDLTSKETAPETSGRGDDLPHCLVYCRFGLCIKVPVPCARFPGRALGVQVTHGGRGGLGSCGLVLRALWHRLPAGSDMATLEGLFPPGLNRHRVSAGGAWDESFAYLGPAQT